MMGRWEGRGGPREARKRESQEAGEREREKRDRKGEEGGENRSNNSWKTRKWQEMGSCEQDTDWPPKSPQRQLPFPLQRSDSSLAGHPLQGFLGVWKRSTRTTAREGRELSVERGLEWKLGWTDPSHRGMCYSPKTLQAASPLAHDCDAGGDPGPPLA